MKLHAETRGDGPALVLLHGWGLSCAVFAPLVPRLEQRFRITLVDLPGHGRSAAAAVPPDLEEWAEAVAEVAPPGSAWLGWSLGGQVAAAAALAGHDIQRLVLVATTPRFLAEPGWPCGVPAAVLQGFAASLATDHRKTVRDFLSLQLRGDARAAALLRTLRGMLDDAPPPRPEGLVTGLQILADTDLRPRLRALRTPALVVAGERDRLTPAAAGRHMAEALPQARFLALPGAAHAPFLTHEAMFLDALASFLGAEAVA